MLSFREIAEVGKIYSRPPEISVCIIWVGDGKGKKAFPHTDPNNIDGYFRWPGIDLCCLFQVIEEFKNRKNTSSVRQSSTVSYFSIFKFLYYLKQTAEEFKK